MSLDFMKILNQIKNFDVTEFEKLLTPEEVEKFRPYIMSYHRLALRYQRALELLKMYGIKFDG